MTPNTLIKELATELGTVIKNIDEAHLRENAEEELVDMAARLVLALKKKAITITPVSSREAEIAESYGAAAVRIFDVFTGWLRTHSTFCVALDTSTTGKFGVALRSGMTPLAFFQGETVQDACAQAAQTIEMNEGEHNERAQD